MCKAWAGAGVAIFIAAGSVSSQELFDLFGRLDANKDGYVTADEVQEPQKGLFERLIRNGDKDGDGKLSQEEFRSGLRPGDGPRGERGAGPRDGEATAGR